nr:SLC13 family permease [Pseudonocardia sp. ICBG1293]
MTVAAAHGVRSLVVALMVGMGATAGSFSPLGVFGIIVRRIQTDSGLPVDPLLLFLSTMVIGTAAAVLVGVLVRSTDDTSPTTVTEPAPTTPGATRPPRSAVVATLVGMAVLVVGAIGFGLDIGFLALTIALALMLAHPDSAPGAVRDVSWGIVLLLAGIVTYVGVLQRNGTIAWVADTVSTVQPALLAALLICVIGAVVSAFASTAGILTAVVPLTVPLVATGDLSAVGLVAALAISSSLVDVSPFSTCGAIAMANAPEHERESIYRGLLVFAGAAAVAGPVVSWAVLVATGWF